MQLLENMMINLIKFLVMNISMHLHQLKEERKVQKKHLHLIMIIISVRRTINVSTIESSLL